MSETAGCTVFGPVDERELLTSQYQRDRALAVFEREAPSLGCLRCIRWTNQSDVRNCAQRTQLLDRLVRRTILTQPDRVVGVDVDDVSIHDARQPHWRSHVVGENQERRPIRNYSARQRHAVHDRAHSVLADTEMKVSARIVLRGKAGLAFDDGVGRARQVG